jgi:hypothetical protein
MTTEQASQNPTPEWQIEAKRFMEENNNRYAAAVAERKAEKARAMEDLYQAIRTQR